jgi:hypothetical protein
MVTPGNRISTKRQQRIPFNHLFFPNLHAVYLSLYSYTFLVISVIKMPSPAGSGYKFGSDPSAFSALFYGDEQEEK